ncbi:adhesion G-protein coupled receptor G6-like isoform X2 [Choristoneura fumiferana]
MIRTTTAAPGVTVVDTPENASTEAYIKTTIPAKTPEEELNQMLEGLDNLLSNESSIVTVDNVADAFDQLDVLLDAEELEFPCTMLHALDALGGRADLNGSQAVTTARHNVAVVMADSAPAHPVRGLRIAANDYGFSDDSFEIFHGDVDTNILSSDNSEAVVNLPQSLSETSRRISFVVFRSNRAFVRHDRNDQYVVNSRVISVNVENFTQMNEGEVIDIHFKPSIHNPVRNMTRACAYWHFTDNGTGYWSQEGCSFISSASGLLDTCRCTHLTHFAEVLVPKAVFSEENEKALKIISLVGCFLSLFGLIVIALTAIVFRSWRNDFNNRIWIQLTLALLINVTCFLIIVFSRFQNYNMFCFFVGVLLHYSVLASFCWMLVAAIISYRKLVLIFARDPPRKLLKASAFSWFCPLAIVTILVAVSPESYVKKFEDKVPSAAFCYPSGLSLWLSVYTPIALIVLTNWILFALIIRSVFATSKIQKHGDSSELFRRASVSCLLVFLFGLPWVFGLFAYNIVAAYLFTFTTSYQGFVLFIFFVIVNTKTRDLWLNKLHMKKKKTKAPVSSSLLTNRSEPARDESEQQAFIEPTSSRTNITSLMSNASSGRAVEYNVSTGSAVIEDTNSFKRYESEGSFVTAKSFNNLYEDENNEDLENDDENSLDIAIRKVVEEEDIKLRKKSELDETRSSTSEKSEDDIKDVEVKNDGNKSPRNSKEIKNHDSFQKSTTKELNENNSDDNSNVENPDADTSASHRKSNNSEGGQKYDENDSSRKQGNGNEKDFHSPEIIIYNIPTQSASLIS